MVQESNVRPSNCLSPVFLCSHGKPFEVSVPKTMGNVTWWRLPNGQLHRVGGPAVEKPSGDRLWWVHNELHREDGPAIESLSGTTEWYQYGKLHRLDGPATETSSGAKYWYQYGKLHRLDGPASCQNNGIRRWCLWGFEVTQAEVAQARMLPSEALMVAEVLAQDWAGSIPSLLTTASLLATPTTTPHKPSQMAPRSTKAQ